MSIISSNILAGASGQGGGYQISRSVRLRASASAYFNRTPSGVGNRQKWTWSGWVKRGTLGATTQVLFVGGQDGSNYTNIYFTGVTNDNLELYTTTGAVNSGYYYTSAVFRDPSAWYHIVIAVDTTATTKVVMYINGVSQTLTISTAMASSYNTWINTANAHKIGSNQTLGNYFDGYLTEINFIDGQALTPSSFGSTNAVTGVWQPIKYTGTYGTNGFYLNFSDNSSNTATTIGKDYSGNGNNWTPNNISVTAGATYDSMTDVPTLTSATVANYNTLNPDIRPYTVTPAEVISNGNLTLTCSSSGVSGSAWGTTLATSGKFYFEATLTTAGPSNDCVGFSNNTTVAGLGTFANDARGWGWFYQSSGSKTINGTTTAYGTSYTTGDVIGIALDIDNLTITFYKNNTSQGQLTSLSLASGSAGWLTAIEGFNGTVWNANFGQRPFTYTPPSGFVALNTQNLSSPTISNGAAYMAATTFNGITGGTQTITNTVNGIGFQPDFVWMKLRSGVQDHFLVDSVRGSSNILVSNTTAVETTGATTFLTSFNSNGWSLGSSGYGNGVTVVGWQWKAGTTSASNTNGSITSTVSVGATQGFSVVTFTTASANATVGHGLGVAPKMIIYKTRATTSDWFVYHASLTSAAYYLWLDTTAAQTNAVNYNNSTAPTSSVFSVGTAWGSNTLVAYCFSEVAGYSKFGSYTGNGSADGPFVYLGFRPRFVLFKRTDSADDWILFDTSRNTYDVMNSTLFPNGNYSETTDSNRMIDALSNGFKVRSSPVYINASSGTYIYMAFAENPFKYSLAR